MSYKFDDFKSDYSEVEDYIGREDELAFMHSLCSAFGGDMESMRVLGDIYSSSGYGVKTDFDKAVFWYGKAVNVGDISSALRLADIYYCYENKGVPNDYEKALALYKTAADGGITLAISRLGQMYLYGMGCEKDSEKARPLLERAAKEGEREACCEYAHILKDEGAQGWFDYLKKSADNSYGKACWEIIQSRADELTDRQFLMYLVYAANDFSKGYNPVEAQLMAADCFMYGKRVTKSENSAKSYYLYAAELGSEEAKQALKKHFNIDYK